MVVVVKITVINVAVLVVKIMLINVVWWLWW